MVMEVPGGPRCCSWAVVGQKKNSGCFFSSVFLCVCPQKQHVGKKAFFDCVLTSAGVVVWAGRVDWFAAVGGW